MNIKIFKKRAHKSKNLGSTLIELLLYMMIFSILTVALFQLFVMIIETQLESQSTSSVLVDGQYVLNRFNYDIKRAKNIISPMTGGQSSTLELSIDTTTYIYTLTNGNITIASSGAQTSDQLNSTNTNVSDLSFTHLGDTQGNNTDTITISFNINSNVSRQGGPQSENFKTTFGIRPKQ